MEDGRDHGDRNDDGSVTAAPVARAAADQRVERFPTLRRLFLLDIASDPASRGTLIWAGFTLLGGMLAYHLIEGWDFLTALYFSVITLCTIGYGDFTPTTQLGRAFTIFYAINGIVVLLALFDRIRIVRGRQPRKGRRASS